MHAPVADDGDGALEAADGARDGVRGGLALDEDGGAVGEARVGGQGEARGAEAHRHDAHRLRERGVVEVARELHDPSAIRQKRKSGDARYAR